MRRFLEADDKREWNVSGYYKRAVQYCQDALNDLPLYANRLPEKKRRALLTRDNVEPFILSLLNPEIDADLSNERRVEIAIMLVTRGLEECLKHIPSSELHMLFAQDKQRILSWLRALKQGIRIGKKEVT